MCLRRYNYQTQKMGYYFLFASDIVSNNTITKKPFIRAWNPPQIFEELKPSEYEQMMTSPCPQLKKEHWHYILNQIDSLQINLYEFKQIKDFLTTLNLSHFKVSEKIQTCMNIFKYKVTQKNDKIPSESFLLLLSFSWKETTNSENF